MEVIKNLQKFVKTVGCSELNSNLASKQRLLQFLEGADLVLALFLTLKCGLVWTVILSILLG